MTHMVNEPDGILLVCDDCLALIPGDEEELAVARFGLWRCGGLPAAATQRCGIAPPLIRELYSAPCWRQHSLTTRNQANGGVPELLLVLNGPAAV